MTFELHLFLMLFLSLRYLLFSNLLSRVDKIHECQDIRFAKIWQDQTVSPTIPHKIKDKRTECPDDKEVAVDEVLVALQGKDCKITKWTLQTDRLMLIIVRTLSSYRFIQITEQWLVSFLHCSHHTIVF